MGHTLPSYIMKLGFVLGLVYIVVLFNLSTVQAADCKKTAKGTEYGGHIAKTQNGLTCRNWADKGWPDMYFPNDGYSAKAARNYCRNPNNMERPWCYIDDADTFQYCNVPLCDSVRPTLPPSGCSDTDGDCPQFKALGYCEPSSQYYNYMKTNCKKSCGLCVNPTLKPTLKPTTQPPKPTLPPSDCKDKDEHCVTYKNLGYCKQSSEYYPFMKGNCPKACGFCGTGGDRAWRDDLKCGATNPLPSGRAAQCNPDSDYPCCSAGGWCGYTNDHCNCATCIDYRNDRGCKDNHEYCQSWAAAGECKNNPGFMDITCKKSCNKC